MTFLTLQTESTLAVGGAAVAKAPDGRVVFVEGAAPDEHVHAEIVQNNRRFARARLKEVLRPSRDRMAPPCPHYTDCGGCKLQHVAYSAQVRSKQAALLTTLKRIGRVEPKVVHPPWVGEPYGYRSRARFALTSDGRLGFRRSRGREVVEITGCGVLAPALQKLVTSFGDMGQPARGLELNTVTDGHTVAAAWRGNGPQPAIPALQWAGRVKTEPPPLTVDGIGVHPLVFTQANPKGNLAIRDQLAEWLTGLAPVQTAIELYAGSGNFTLVLADHAAQTSCYEASPDAVVLARRALPAHVKMKVATAEDAVKAQRRSVDVVLVDPPRNGLTPEVADGLAEWAERALLYVSCDPATFARDAGRWAVRGWRLAEVRLFDLYPQTAHSEVAGLFVPDSADTFSTDTFARSPG
ncbi:MAG: TRAM domain-containing protein [Myxococcota bacterium]